MLLALRVSLRVERASCSRDDEQAEPADGTKVYGCVWQITLFSTNYRILETLVTARRVDNIQDDVFLNSTVDETV